MSERISVDARVAGDALSVSIEARRLSQRVVYETRAMLPLNAYSEAPHLTELFEFFLALYAADRLSPRPDGRWRRDLRIAFPVTNLEAWRSSKAVLEQLIFQSMGDDVELVLSERSHSEVHVDRRQRRFHFDQEQSKAVALLSDGLDSFAGAFAPFSGKGGSVAFVSLVTNTRKGDTIARVVRFLRERFPGRVRSHLVDLHLDKAPRSQEPSQRSRTLLAIAAGLTVAAAHGAKDLMVFEGGIGILNMPFHPLQMTHQSSQALHPANLALWADLSRALVGGALVSYPNRFKTKAQLLLDIPYDARHMIRVTSSCDAPRHGVEQDCGRCSSCVFRRTALRVAGMLQYDKAYAPRAKTPLPYDPEDVFWRQAVGIRDALAQSDPWPALLKVQPTLRRALVERDAEARSQEFLAVLALLREHVREMESVRQLAYAI